MILMGLFSLILIVGIPYITENSKSDSIHIQTHIYDYCTDTITVDEETKKEFEEIQSKNPVTAATSRASDMQNFDMAGWLAGKTSS